MINGCGEPRIRSCSLARRYENSFSPSLPGQRACKFGKGHDFVGWRMGWDSNPRYGLPHAGFQDRFLKPLGHPSSDRIAVCRPLRATHPNTLSVANNASDLGSAFSSFVFRVNVFQRIGASRRGANRRKTRRMAHNSAPFSRGVGVRLAGETPSADHLSNLHPAHRIPHFVSHSRNRPAARRRRRR